MTPKREVFCLAYVETGNASEAYRRAFAVKPETKPESIHVNASKLLSDAKVLLRVAELKASHVERHNLTVDDIKVMLLEDRKFARYLESPAAAISASMGLAKLYGFLTDKVDLSGTMKVIAASPLDEQI